MQVKVIFDKYSLNKNLHTGWGVSFLIGEHILFDTGEDGELLINNMKSLKVDFNKLKTVVISHDHWDHTGGLWALLKKRPHLNVYGCPKFSSNFKKNVQMADGSLIEKDKFSAVDDNIYVTGEIAGAYGGLYMPEQALIVKTGNGDEALIFFTDYYNQPRFINNLRSYALPSGNVDQLNEEALLVIKKPPIAAPTIELSETTNQENFLDERFISFAYRYKYRDGEYSAISQFSRPAFEPNPYEFSVDSFLNEGMVNFYNKATITYNTGGPLVTGIDILFKDMSTGIIKVIEKIDKTAPDNTDVQYEFSNSKIFTILPESEILRLYDNVPLLAKAQTIMGNRLMYGNYVEGYDLLTDDNQPVLLNYVVSLESSVIGLTSITGSTTSGSYTIDGAITVNDSRMLISLADVDLVKGAAISIDFRFEHDQFSGGSPSATTQPIESTFNFVLPKDYTSVYEMATSVEFQNAVGTVTNIQPFADACDGNTFTDIFNCAVPDTLGVYTKEDSGIANDGDPIAIITSPTSNLIGFQLPAVKYVDNSGGGGADAYEYYSVNFIDASFTEIANPTSLHSNRGYEIGIVYMDEFNRSTTALVSEQNNIHVPCSASSLQLARNSRSDHT